MIERSDEENQNTAAFDDIKESQLQGNDSNTDAMNCFAVEIISAALVGFGGIMSLAVPESTHGTMGFELFPMMVAILPFVIGNLFKPERYHALKRAAIIWFCASLILVISHTVNAKNISHGVYNCSGSYSACWSMRTGCDEFFAVLGIFSGLFLSLFLVLSLITTITRTNRNLTVLMLIFISSCFTLSLITPISLAPLLRPLRPYQTIISILLLSFPLAIVPVAPPWTFWIFSALCLLQSLVNVWSFAQNEQTPMVLAGISASVSYILAALLLIPSDYLSEPVQDAQD